METKHALLQPLPTIFIGKDKINQRVKLYQQIKHPLLSQELSSHGIPRQETKSIWYSKQHIETLLSEINQMDADGLRIYFGAYEQGSGIADGQLCLLMVLTRGDADGFSHTDIILEHESGFEERVQMAQKRSAEPGIPREYNYGSPCPPICPSKEPGFPLD